MPPYQIQISRKKMIRSKQKLNIAGVKFGIIIIMTAMCLVGCSKEKAFVDSCDSEIAE